MCVPDAVQHDAPHALLHSRSHGIGALSWCSADPGPPQTLRSALVGAGFKHAPAGRREASRKVPGSATASWPQHAPHATPVLRPRVYAEECTPRPPGELAPG